MPELPEVEVSRLGLTPHLLNQPLLDFIARRADLRLPIPRGLKQKLVGKKLITIARRGKYLLFHFADSGGTLILHLGMSGSLRLVNKDTPVQTHDHVDLVFPQTVLRFRDPRRFGVLVWQKGDDPYQHPLLASLGIEPLADEFTVEWLYQVSRKRTQAIKPLLMDAHVLVGVGNIYASESLFRARIAPTKAAGRLTREQCARLVPAVREVLTQAIAAGGSSVRDYVHSDGGAGSFQLQVAVYGRTGLPCPVCGTAIKEIKQAGRATFYCPHCVRKAPNKCSDLLSR